MRKIPLSHRSHIIGFQPLANGATAHESALERDFVTLTTFLEPKASIVAQPLTLIYHDAGIRRRYTPDYLVSHSQQTRELIEIKYQADLETLGSSLQGAFAAARRWALENSATFRVVTEREIRGPRLENAKRLLPLRQAPLDAGMAMRMMTAMTSSRTMTIGALLAQCPQERSAVLATLWRLIARGLLQVDLAIPIAFGSRITLP